MLMLAKFNQICEETPNVKYKKVNCTLFHRCLDRLKVNLQFPKYEKSESVSRSDVGCRDTSLISLGYTLFHMDGAAITSGNRPVFHPASVCRQIILA